MIKLEIEIIGYRIIIRHIANTQSVINVTRTDLLYGVLSLSIIFGGKMDNKFKRIIEFKKQKGSVRKPKYATRKLSIGLVSCMLGYALLVSPSSVEAAELDSENQAVAEESAEPETTSEEDPVEENKETETPAEETPAEESKEESPEETPDKEAPAEETTTENKEAAVEDFTLTEEQRQNLKEAGFTDSEIKEIEAEIASELEADPKFDIDSFLKEITEQKAAELEKSEEAKAEPIAAGEKKITNIQGTIDGDINPGIDTVKPLAQGPGEGYDTILKTAFSFDVPDAITGGDTFEVTVSDNVNIHGISEVPVIDDLYYNGELLAKAEVQADGRTIIYRFTDYVDKIANIKMNISFPLFIDKVNVPENSTQKVVVTVDGNQFSKTFAVDYSRDGYFKSEEKDVETLSGKANLDTVTDTSYHHTIYVNTNNQELTNSQLRIRNQDGTDGAIFDQGVLDSVKVYRLNDGKQLKGSFNLDYADLTDVTENATIRKPLNEKMGMLVDINQKNDKASYVVVYDGKRKEKTSLNTIVEFGAASKKRMDGTPEGTVSIADKNWSWKNDVHFDDGDGSATGEEKPKVYKLGDTVWYDDNGNGIQDEGEKPAANVYVTINVDGKKTSLRTDKDGKYVFNNLPNGEYELTFSHFDGYKITTPNAGGNDELDSDGVLTDGVVTAKGIIKDSDNMSVDLGLIKETYTLGDRVWLDANKDGLQTEGEEGVEGVTVKLTGGDLTEAKTTTTDAEGNYKFEGLKNGEYKVTFELPKGYKVTDTNIGDDDEKDSDGVLADGVVSAKGTIKDANNMSVDLGLIEEEKEGKVIVHYVDEEGKTIKEDAVDTPDSKYGTEYNTSDDNKPETIDFEGKTYKFEKVQDGDKETGTIEQPVTEVTYIYKLKEAPVEETYVLGDRVWLDANKDGLQTEGEKGIKGVTVKLTGEGIEEKTTTTDAEGNYKFEGLKNGEYKVTFVLPEGYELTKTDEGTDDEKDSDGKEVTVTIKDADDMSIDLGLIKVTETPWTPLEPSEPVEPETPDIPWLPLEPSEPIEPGTPGETPDIPWTPLEPSEPVEPEKPETPDKPEKPGKPETPEDNKDNKVQVPVVESKKEAKKETPTRKKSNPKTGVGSISGAALGLIAAASGLFVSKKNKDEE